MYPYFVPICTEMYPLYYDDPGTQAVVPRCSTTTLFALPGPPTTLQDVGKNFEKLVF